MFFGAVANSAACDGYAFFWRVAMMSSFGEYELVNGAVVNRLQGEVNVLRAEQQLSEVAIHDMRYVIEWVMAEMDVIEREATHSDDADATLNAIVLRIQRCREALKA